MSRAERRCALVLVLLSALLPGPAAWAQGSPNAPGSRSPQATPAKDALGRDTPRGTVLGFMEAAGSAHDDVAAEYLDTKLPDAAAGQLARKLFVVLDSRLPPRLTEISDEPEGSLVNPLKPDQDIVGTITTDDGTLDLVLQRVKRAGSGPVWLFSRQTLAAIPDVYDDVNLVKIDRFLPDFLVKRRIAGVRLFEWIVLVLIFPVSYRLAGLLGRLLRPVAVRWRRRRGSEGELPANIMPGAARLLLMAVAIRWLLGVVELPLAERAFWSAIATSLTIGGVVWLFLMVNGAAERHIYRRSRTSGHGEVAATLRLARRVADVVVLAAGGIVMLRYVGVDPTAALAGLGIGGIAVALAAQKTLENVIGGLSIIFDEAVRVGDFIKFGDALGSVDYIGLRSTRIRTLDRTVLSVPNGQLANANIETLSARDKFWFHHFVGLRYETSAGQLRSVVEGIHTYLRSHPMIDSSEEIRVRFLRLGPSSLDIEVFAYVAGADWEAFLGTQQELLLEIIGIVERSGTAMALPSQTLHLARGREAALGAGRIGPARSARVGPRHRPAESA